MKLTIIPPTHASGVATISVYKSGYSGLSAKAVKDMGINEKSRITFAIDAATKKAYIGVTDSEDTNGFKAVSTNGSININTKYILSQLGLKVSSKYNLKKINTKEGDMWEVLKK